MKRITTIMLIFTTTLLLAASTALADNNAPASSRFVISEAGDYALVQPNAGRMRSGEYEMQAGSLSAIGTLATSEFWWRLGSTSEGISSYDAVIGRLVSTAAAFRSNQDTDIYHIFPAPASQTTVQAARFYILDRTGSYDGTATLTLEILDYAGALQHSVSAASVDMQLAAPGTWTDLTLSGTPADLQISPGEFLAFHFALSGASGGSLDVRPVFEVEVVSSTLSPPSGPIYLPIIMKNSVIAPDLVVDSLVATSTTVTVTIRNQGNAPVNDEFWVDVYFDPNETPSLNHPWETIADHGVVWGVTDPIPVGGSLVLTTDASDPYYVPEYSSTPPLPVGAEVWALVDSVDHNTTYGAVQESDESNNLCGPVTSTAATGEAVPVFKQSQPASREGLPAR
ncbi:MAG: hypothetical protein ACETWR_21420 [Anaerolineae bacterium]